MIKKEIDDAVEKNFKEIDKAIENGDLNKSIRLLELQAEFFYKSNICYCSDILEQKFNTILCKFEKKERLLDLNSKKVIFYDYFALENRGLALIYLKGLVKNGYEVVYISYACKIQCLSRIQEILKSKKHKMIFLSTQSDYRTLYCELYNVFITERPMHAFLYTYPSDVVGIGVFQNLPIDIKRYQINLTDHAYWLGVNAFDYCIEFRNYGIYISEKYRHISSSKILVQPYYPECNSSEDYGGIPFTVKTNQLIMFSGGSIYKTLDNENTFYDLVEKLLLKYDNLIFWYASETTCASLRHLINTYPNRVYHTKERKDIYQVLCHIDIYLNTYPISGGLMLQYAAIAGKVPFTLVHDDDAYGVLLDNSEVYYKDEDELLHNISRYIEDGLYRKKMNESMYNRVITKEYFDSNLKSIIEYNTSCFRCNLQNVDTNKFKKSYNDNFSKFDYYKMIACKKYMLLVAAYPVEILIGSVLKIRGKIINLVKGYLKKV